MTQQTAQQPFAFRDAAAAPTTRDVAKIIGAPAPHWVGDGFHVHGYFSVDPGLAHELSPFVLLDYAAPYVYPPTSNLRRGVGPHPHRGFETVTLAFQGSVAHHDSAGNGGVIGPGDVQWMTAASGVLHREYHAESFARSGGPMQMVQLWVNLPKAHKLSPPSYQGIENDQIGVAQLPDGAGQVRVIAGEYGGVRGPARTFTPIAMLDAKLEPGATARFSFAEGTNTAVLVMNGPVRINDADKASTNDLVIFERTGAHFDVQAPSGAHVLVLNGEPIDEPVVQYGPFVMNTAREIQDAIRDFNSGKFGELPA